ncbi:MAG: hypothetical protein M3Y35_05840 [Actinomycetota bacterium]|nr:hypothetical protein [Actinomycetota bacterium]
MSGDQQPQQALADGMLAARAQLPAIDTSALGFTAAARGAALHAMDRVISNPTTLLATGSPRADRINRQMLAFKYDPYYDAAQPWQISLNRYAGHLWIRDRLSRSGFGATAPWKLTAAAVSWAGANGARSVTLVGPSAGGGHALVAASRITPTMKAVIDLSGDNDDSAEMTTAAPSLTMPTLYAVAPDDSHCPLSMRALLAASPHGNGRLSVQSTSPEVGLPSPRRSASGPLATAPVRERWPAVAQR